MDIVIASLSDAVVFQPTKKTYAIRIFSDQYPEQRRIPLQESALYAKIAEYVFDDLELGRPSSPGLAWPTLDIAERIVADFQAGGLECECLLVHCSRGKNRAPAVAIALNEVFGLGQDTMALKEKYLNMNTLVYALMIEAGKKLVP